MTLPTAVIQVSLVMVTSNLTSKFPRPHTHTDMVDTLHISQGSLNECTSCYLNYMLFNI